MPALRTCCCTSFRSTALKWLLRCHVQQTVEGAWVILGSEGFREHGEWQEVVGLVGAGTDTADIAASTLGR